MTTTMKIEFIIKTDADPSEVLDLAIDLQENVVDCLQSCDYPTSADEGSVSVWEIG